MSTETMERAKQLAQAESLRKENKDVEIYIIYCFRNNLYYVDKNSFIRLFEQIIGNYTNGIFTETDNN